MHSCWLQLLTHKGGVTLWTPNKALKKKWADWVENKTKQNKTKQNKKTK